MQPAMERAGTAPTVPAQKMSPALAGGTETNPIEDRTMTSNITPGDVPATGSEHAVPSLSGSNSTPSATTIADSSNPQIVADEHLPDSAPERQKCPAVRQLGRMVPGYGYRAENSDWLDCLTEPDPRHPGMRIGLDPMTIKTALLTLAGHPPRKTGALVSAKRRAMGDASDWYMEVQRYSDIPEHVCLPCSGTAHGVRQCAIINCPMWAYRGGRNPHSPRRGKAPTHLLDHQFVALRGAMGQTKRTDGEAR